MPDILKTQSELVSYAGCPQAHLYRYGLRLSPRKPQAALERGSVIHRALERFYNTQDADAAFAALDQDIEQERALFQEHYPPETLAKLDLEWRKVRAVFRAYAGSVGRQDLTLYSVIGNEHEFKFEVRPGWYFGGKVDGLFLEKASGKLVLFEHKYLWDNAGLNVLVRYQPYWYAIGLARDPRLAMRVQEIAHNLIKRPDLRLCKGETPEEFEERVYCDFRSRPLHYLNRRRVAVSESMLAEALRALEILYERSLDGPEKRYRNETPECARRCSFMPICFDPDLGAEKVRELYTVRPSAHPELTVE